jgi:hypothetical protein
VKSGAALSAAVCFAALAWLSDASAAAQVRTAGAADATALIADEAWGGTLSVDLWAVLGEPRAPVSFRLGGAFGAGAITGDDDARSRVLMPVGASASLLVFPSRTWFFEVRARGGMWGGATNQGLGAGGWVSGGAYVGYAVGANAALGAGVSVWWLLGHGDIRAIAPSITAVWFPWED